MPHNANILNCQLLQLNQVFVAKKWKKKITVTYKRNIETFSGRKKFQKYIFKTSVLLLFICYSSLWHFGIHFLHNLQHKEPLSAEASLKYHLLGTPDQFIILSAVSESRYSFTPYSPDAGSLLTLSKLVILN